MKTLSDNQQHQTEAICYLASLLLVLFVVGNVAFVEYVEQHYRSSHTVVFVIGLWQGAIISQPTLHSIWTIFSRGTVLRRGLLSVGTALMLYTSIFGTELAIQYFRRGLSYYSSQYLFFALASLVALPLLLLAVQTPFWILRTGLRYSISPPNSARPVQKPSPMTIQGLLLATAAIAIALALVRAAGTFGNGNPENYTLGVIMLAGFAATASLLFALPIFIKTLQVRSLAPSLTFVVLLQALFVAGLLSVFRIFTGEPRGNDCWLLANTFFGFELCLIGPLLIARWLGYRLERFDHHAPPESEIGTNV